MGWCWRGLILCAAVAAGCGRLGYDPLADPSGDAADSGADAAAGDDGGHSGDDGGDTSSSSGSFTVPLGEDGDDGMIDADGLFTGGAPDGRIHLGRSGGRSSWGYFRFRSGRAVPPGATITAATVQLWSAASSGWDDTADRLFILVENVPDAPRVSDAREAPDSGIPGWERYGTATRVVWSPGGLAWPLGTWRTSPSLATPLQELVDTHGGLDTGAHIQLWVSGHDLATDATVATSDWSATSGQAARLSVSWTVP